MNDENYNPFSTNGMLDLAAILGFMDTENDCVAADSRAETFNTSPLQSSSVPVNWLPRQASVPVSDIISSPFDALDTVRTEQNDFQTNGIVMELDEFDLYQAKLREVPLPSPVTKLDTPEPITADAKRKKKAKSLKNTVCVFCKNNGETLSVYGTHLLKDASGRVTCPILRRYTCPICGAVGDSAHTLKYCPLNTNPVSCLSILRSPRASNGKCRQPIN